LKWAGVHEHKLALSPLNIPVTTIPDSLSSFGIQTKLPLCEYSTSVNQKRILQVSATPVFDLGGVGKIVQWLVGDLSGHYRVSLASPDAEWSGMPEELASRLDTRISIPPYKWDNTSSRHFLKQIKEGNYDLIHFHGGTYSFDGHLPWRGPLHRLCMARLPWIFSNHCAPSLTDSLFPPRYPRVAKFLKSVVAWSSKGFLLRCCLQEIFDSDENRSQIERWFPWAKAKMRTIYHSGLEGSPPRPELSPEVVIIANLGHIGWRKGQHDLLTAFASVQQKIPRLRLILAGPQLDEECARRIRSEISLRKLEGIVQMPGGLTDKTAFWQAVDIYVQPSHYEGAPMALMEALWQGKPAIGTNVSGIPEMIQHNFNGLLVEPSKPAEMAEAIEKLVVESETRRRFSEKAAETIQARGMTRKDMFRNYAELYNEIFATRRPHR
jgi:glycosyltransferase involved in cell wall biosynthesis